MILGDDVFNVLQAESEFSERSISSHWVEYLKGFRYENGEFSGKGLSEGGGGRRSFKEGLLEYVFQTPFRRQGKQFAEFGQILKCAKQVHKQRNTSLLLGSLRQVLSLSLLQSIIALDQLEGNIIVVGDGFGTMTSLLLSYLTQKKPKIILVNLTQNLLIDAVFIKKSVLYSNICLVKDIEAYRSALRDSEINVICIQADNAQLISSASIGLLINIASMQEMNPSVIGDYFRFMRSSPNQKTYFYCANRIEKVLPDGVVSSFFGYPWHQNDNIIVDELCPWHQQYYDYKRPPFYCQYDGAHQHRLVMMHKDSKI
jgi:hypothetical protein